MKKITTIAFTCDCGRVISVDIEYNKDKRLRYKIAGKEWKTDFNEVEFDAVSLWKPQIPCGETKVKYVKYKCECGKEWNI